MWWGLGQVPGWGGGGSSRGRGARRGGRLGGADLCPCPQEALWLGGTGLPSFPPPGGAPAKVKRRPVMIHSDPSILGRARRHGFSGVEGWKPGFAGGWGAGCLGWVGGA